MSSNMFPVDECMAISNIVVRGNYYLAQYVSYTDSP